MPPQADAGVLPKSSVHLAGAARRICGGFIHSVKKNDGFMSIDRKN